MDNVAIPSRTTSPREEIANGITHGAGLVLSLAGLIVLVVFAVLRGTIWHIVSFSIFGATLVMLYAASTVYHSARSERLTHYAKIVDHASIYLLIAGTYTPFTLVSLRGTWGWSLFGLVWGLAVAGVAMEGFWVYRPKPLSVIVYLLMGWLIVVAAKPLFAALPPGGLWLLLVGGLSYTAGVIFYLMKKVPYMHAVWHLFVLGGSVCHFLAVMIYVLPTRLG